MPKIIHQPGAAEGEHPPPPETLRAREHKMVRRLGRLGRLRSWATIFVGLAALAALAAVVAQTR
jgi:hypothetical protein